MARGIAVFVMIIGGLIPEVFGADASHPQFRSDAGGFSVNAPIALTERTVSRDVVVGKLVTHVFTGQQGQVAYTVSYTDLLHGVQPADLEKALDGSRNGAVCGLNGKLVFENSITLDGNPGRELVILTKARNGDTRTVKVHIFLVKARVYQVMVAGAKEERTGSETDSFLQSFRLLAE